MCVCEREKSADNIILFPSIIIRSFLSTASGHRDPPPLYSSCQLFLLPLIPIAVKTFSVAEQKDKIKIVRYRRSLRSALGAVSLNLFFLEGGGELSPL